MSGIAPGQKPVHDTTRTSINVSNYVLNKSKRKTHHLKMKGKVALFPNGFLCQRREYELCFFVFEYGVRVGALMFNAL